jgi:hypothetical protein
MSKSLKKQVWYKVFKDVNLSIVFSNDEERISVELNFFNQARKEFSTKVWKKIDLVILTEAFRAASIRQIIKNHMNKNSK